MLEVLKVVFVGTEVDGISCEVVSIRPAPEVSFLFSKVEFSTFSSPKRNLNISKKEPSSSSSLTGIFSVESGVPVVVGGLDVVEVCLARKGTMSPIKLCRFGAGSVLMTSRKGSGVTTPSATVTGSGIFGGISILARTTVGDSSSPKMEIFGYL